MRLSSISAVVMVVVGGVAARAVGAEPSPTPSATPASEYASCTLTDKDYAALAHPIKGSLTRADVEKLPPDERVNLCKSRMFAHRVAEANEKHVTMEKLAEEFPDKKTIPAHASRYLTAEEYDSGVRDLWMLMIAAHVGEHSE